ncbi:MAG: ABC transporter permease [Spirochaetaceae bacterium]
MKLLNKITYNGATVLGLIFTVASLFLPLINIKKNRIDLGILSSLNDYSADVIITCIVIIILLIILSTSVLDNYFKIVNLAQLLRQGSGLLLLFLLGRIIIESNFKIEATGNLKSQISFESGFYMLLLGAYFQIVGTVLLIKNRDLKIYYIAFVLAALLIILFLINKGHYLGIVKELLKERKRFSKEVLVHISISFRSVLYASIIGIPTGILSWRRKKFKNIIFSIINSIQTIPSLALFGLIIAPLAALSNKFPVLKSMGIKGIGVTPALIALTLYALLPIVRNTYIGLDSINSSIVDAGKGMGMTKKQRFFKIELPLSIPLLLTGIKIAAIQSLGNTTIAALIGAGGLGFFVFRGLEQIAPDLILIGVIPIVLLVLISDKFLSILIHILTPKPLRSNSD